MITLLLGPQGSGKGTQGELLSEALGIPTFSVGSLLREEKQTGSELGKLIASYIDRGELVPPDVATDTLWTTVQRDAKGGAFIDGYPRDKNQLSMMFDRFTPGLAIVLDVPKEVTLDRLGGRWVCPKGHAYNEKYRRPKVEGVCDEDGEKLYQRDDDTEEAIKVRLDIYEDRSKPLIEGLEHGGVKIEYVDATGSIEEVQELVLEVMKKYGVDKN